MSFHFFRVSHAHGTFSSIWQIFGDRGVRVGISNAEAVANAFCTPKPGQSVVDSICELMNSLGSGDCSHWPLNLHPGQYHPRMARPSDQHSTQSPGDCPGALEDRNTIAMGLGQLNVLTKQLSEICQTIHPDRATLETYGHAIRNLLILACTEVEAHWRGILVANGVGMKRFQTNDYVKLMEAMRLDEYAVRYPHYPWLISRRPFAGWNSEAPTQSLTWYDAYNSVKHDRETSFSRGTLGHAFDAVSACAIMLLAQYGNAIAGWRDSDVARFFDVHEVPDWSPSDVYTLNYESVWAGQEAWLPVNYAF